MDLGNLASVAAVIIALFTCAGLALQRGVVTGLRGQNEDYEKRIVFLEAKGVRDDATIAAQKADLAALQRVVTGEVHWTAISDLLEDHHKAATENWRRGEELLIEIRDDIRGRLK